MIANPKYKGKWRLPMIPNPNYQGIWEPRKIANPEYFEETNPFQSLTPFSALGLELWSMTENIYFDNFIITNDEQVARQLAKDSWSVRHELELNQKSKSTEEAKPEAEATDAESGDSEPADADETEADDGGHMNDEL
jgi:hypothetical protein